MRTPSCILACLFSARAAPLPLHPAGLRHESAPFLPPPPPPTAGLGGTRSAGEAARAAQPMAARRLNEDKPADGGGSQAGAQGAPASKGALHQGGLISAILAPSMCVLLSCCLTALAACLRPGEGSTAVQSSAGHAEGGSAWPADGSARKGSARPEVPQVSVQSEGSIEAATDGSGGSATDARSVGISLASPRVVGALEMVITSRREAGLGGEPRALARTSVSLRA